MPSEHAFAKAALLALKGKGTLSHFSAAHVWKLCAYPHVAQPWVTVPAGVRATRPNIQIVRAELRRFDTRTRDSLRLTSPPRTVLDCAALYEDDYVYEALVAEAKFRGLAGEKELEQQVERNPGKRGSPRLRRVLELPGRPSGRSSTSCGKQSDSPLRSTGGLGIQGRSPLGEIG